MPILKLGPPSCGPISSASVVEESRAKETECMAETEKASAEAERAWAEAEQAKAELAAFRARPWWRRVFR